MRKAFALFAFALFAHVCAFADDGEYLMLGLAGTAGGVEQVATRRISSIVFANGGLQLTKDGVVVKSYDRSAVRKLYFSSSATAIGHPEAMDANGQSRVYTLEGRLVGKAVDVEALPKGVYIIKKGGKARKIVRP